MDNAQPTPPQPFGSPIPGPTATAPPDKFPVGIILIIILTGFGMIGSLAQVVNPIVMIGTLIIAGPAAFLYGFVQLAVYVALFVWLIQRKEKGRLLGIILTIYIMLIAAITFIASVLRPEEFMELYDSMAPGLSDMVPHGFLAMIMGFATLLNWMVGAAVISYLVFKKRYFRP